MSSARDQFASAATRSGEAIKSTFASVTGDFGKLSLSTKIFLAVILGIFLIIIISLASTGSWQKSKRIAQRFIGSVKAKLGGNKDDTKRW